MYALIVKISKNKETLDKLIDESEILRKEQRMDKYMCYVLMTELLFGTKMLPGESKPVQCILSYKEKFEQILANMTSEATQPEDGMTVGIDELTFGSDAKRFHSIRSRSKAPIRSCKYVAHVSIGGSRVVHLERMERSAEFVREL